MTKPKGRSIYFDMRKHLDRTPVHLDQSPGKARSQTEPMTVPAPTKAALVA